MSTAADVRAAWLASVFSDVTLTTITDKIYDYDAGALAEESEQHLAKLKFDQRFNFISYDIRRAQTFNVIKNQVEFTYPVEIQIVREALLDGTGFIEAIDTFETIFTLVTSTLGLTWGGTVQGFNFQDGAPTITQTSIDGKPVWAALYTYEGFKQTSF